MGRSRPALLMLTALLTALACSLPQPPTGAPPEITPDVGVTPWTEVPPASEAPPPSETPTEPESLVVTHQDPVFNLYALDGTLVESRPANGLQWARPGTAQVVGDAIYYVDSGGSSLGGVVRRVTATGSEELTFTRVPDMQSLTFSVSADESMIAWSSNTWQGSAPVSWLWIADIHGGGLRQIAQTVPGDPIDDFFVLEPVAWVPGGDLVFAWQISGIGGYILFFGYSSLYRHTPASGSTTPLVPLAPETGAPCWSGLSPDAVYAVGACAPGAAVVERDLGTGAETIFPFLPDQGQAGAGAYSPSGARLAYAVARGDMDNEAGQVIVRLNRGEVPVSIASHAPGHFERIEWVDEERMVVGYWQGDVGLIDLLRVDGTRTSVCGGHFVGLLRP